MPFPVELYNFVHNEQEHREEERFQCPFVRVTVLDCQIAVDKRDPVFTLN